MKVGDKKLLANRFKDLQNVNSRIIEPKNCNGTKLMCGPRLSVRHFAHIGLWTSKAIEATNCKNDTQFFFLSYISNSHLPHD